MTEPTAREPFEARLGELVRAYTDPATEEPFDARAVSRAALASRGAAGWVGGLPGWRIAGAPWAAALAAVIVVAVVGIALLQRPFGPATEPEPTATEPTGLVPEELRHAWQRPYAVTPGQDAWGTGYLDISGGILEVRQSLSDPGSRSTISASDVDLFVATATSASLDCASGDVGEYRWALEGKDTVLKLTTFGLDACAERQESLVGTWVRADVPQAVTGEIALNRGTHPTSLFDPFGNVAVAGQLTFNVQEGGWSVVDDRQATMLLHRVPAASEPAFTNDSFVFVFAEPRVATDFDETAACRGLAHDAEGVGTSVEEIAAAILARSSVVADSPAPVTIGGYDGLQLDLRLAPSWTGGCLQPDGPMVGSLLLKSAGAANGPKVGLVPDTPLRLILLDLENGRTVAVAIGFFVSHASEVLETGMADAMTVVESFEFHRPAP